MGTVVTTEACPNDCGDHCGNPAWSREEDHARVDRLKPLAEHLRVGHDVPDSERRYRDTWLHIALLADEWFAEHRPTEVVVTDGMVSAAFREYYRASDHDGRALVRRMIEAALRTSPAGHQLVRGSDLRPAHCSCGEWEPKLGESIFRGFDRHVLEATR